MKSRLLFFLTILLYIFTINSFGQSFESLKRSKGKSVLYAAVEGTLAGSKPVQECLQAISTGELAEPYNGKTPIYLVLDYLAKHPKSECGNAEQLLNAFVAHRDFNVNLRYGSLLPPLAYLIRENHSFLGGKFSKDYISDHVFKKLIEAGASVNTYNSEGESLMTFAIETGNEYLQTYFINNGVNLRHTDSKGYNAMHTAINNADISLIKQLLAKGTFKIDIRSFQNDTEEMRTKQPELYDLLANECLKYATSYEDVTLFQKRFSGKKHLIQSRYEALAQSEINNANNDDAIMVVRERYPDLQKMTEAKRLEIYKKCSDEISRFHSDNLKTTDAEKITIHSTEVNSFIKNYRNYDPDRKIPLAEEMKKFYDVCWILQRESYYKSDNNYSNYTTSRNQIDLAQAFGAPKYKWDFDYTNYARKRITEVEDIMKAGSRYYDDFYNRNLGRIPALREALEGHIDRCYAAFKEYVDEHVYGSSSASDRTTITKVTHPSGKLTTGLFDTYYYHENNGEIKLKSGRSVYYNAFYRSKNGGDFVGYEVTNTLNAKLKKNSNVFGYYKTIEELVNTVANALE